MRTRDWRRQQKHKNRTGKQVYKGCSCMMCSPGRYGFQKHSDLKKTAERVKELEARYLEGEDE